MFGASPQINDVAWSHNSMFAPMIHSMVILAIVSYMWARVRSMGVDEPSNTPTLSKQLSSSMTVSPPIPTMPTSSIGSGYNLHH
jgi:hypothetical protein